MKAGELNTVLNREPIQRAPFWSGRILDRTAEMFGMTKDELTAKTRRQEVVQPRFLAMRALRELGMSFPEIARRLGRTDHGAIIYGCQKADAMMAREYGLRLAYEEIVNAGAPGFFPEAEQ